MRHPQRALLTALVSVGSIVALWSGIWPCPMAKMFHVPCPGCGSTRAVRALLTGDLHGALLNPFAPFVAALFGVLVLRAIGLEYTDGDMRRLDQGWGAQVTKVLLVFAVLEIALWAVRWFGLFGGPVPV